MQQFSFAPFAFVRSMPAGETMGDYIHVQQSQPLCTKDTASAGAHCVPAFRRTAWQGMTDIPWEDAASLQVTPVLVLAQSHLETLGFGAQALRLCKKRQLVRLFRLYREIGLEPLILTDTLPQNLAGRKSDSCAAKASKEDHVRRFLKKTLLMGGRICLVPPNKSLWQAITGLCSGNVLLHPGNFSFVRKCGPVLLLHEAAQRGGIKKDSIKNGKRMLCTARPLAPALDGKRGWPAFLDRATLLLLAEGETSWDALKKDLPLFETADSFAVRDCCDILLQDHLSKKHISKDQFYESLEEGEDWLNKRDAAKILQLMPLPGETLAHVAAVSKAAWAIAQRMRLAGCSVNPELAASSALLHDLAKGCSHHEKVGALLLRSLGLPQMAHCIEDHRDLVLAGDKPVTEREVVYLADKYCLGDSFVPLEVRFGQKTDLYTKEGRPVAGIRKRLAHAKALEARLARELGVSPGDIVRTALSKAPDSYKASNKDICKETI